MLSSKDDEKAGAIGDPKLGQDQHDDSNKHSTKQQLCTGSLQARQTASKTQAECSVHEQNNDCPLSEHQSQTRFLSGSICA